jgi:hypothetical protein
VAGLRTLLRIYDALNESNRFAVLCHARLLVLRQCVVEQYNVERRKYDHAQYSNAHWLG